MSVDQQYSKVRHGITKLLGAMLAPCLQDFSKHDMKQVPEGGYKNINSPFSK